MKIYRLNIEQKLPISLEESWKFFSSPKNLIISGGDSLMYPGQIIQYFVSPLFGLKTKWVTEITHVEEKKYFVDEQRFGPYSRWHHKHFFSQVDRGVKMIDIVDYKLPLGIIGRLAHPILVKPKLDEIFSYRKNKLIEIFGEYK